MHPLIQRRLALLQNPAQGEGGDGGQGGAIDQGGQGGSDDITKTPEFQQALQAAIDKEVNGLKTNRDQVLEKYTKLKDTLKQYEGIDPELARSLQERFDSEEEKELLRKGDIDSIVNRRVDKMKQNYEKQFGELTQREQAAVARQKALEERAIAAEITRAAAEAGALTSALPDFVQRAKGHFALSDDGAVIAVDSNGEPLYDVDGKTPLSIKAWALGLQTDAPHLFGKPNPGGAQGGRGQHQVGSVGGSTQEREAYFRSRYKLPK